MTWIRTLQLTLGLSCIATVTWAHADEPRISTAAWLGAGTNHSASGGFDVQLAVDRTIFGVDIAIGGVRRAYVAGFERRNGARWRLRLPVQLPISVGNTIGDGRRGLDAFLVVAPQVRHLNVDDLSATAIGADLGLATHLWIVPAVSLDVGLSFPVLYDVISDRESQVSRFPGAMATLGATYRLTSGLTVAASATLSITEGYGGDSEKHLFESSIALRYHFGRSISGFDALLGRLY